MEKCCKDNLTSIFKDLDEFTSNPPFSDALAWKNFIAFLKLKYGIWGEMKHEQKPKRIK